MITQMIPGTDPKLIQELVKVVVNTVKITHSTYTKAVREVTNECQLPLNLMIALNTKVQVYRQNNLQLKVISGERPQ